MREDPAVPHALRYMPGTSMTVLCSKYSSIGMDSNPRYLLATNFLNLSSGRFSNYVAFLYDWFVLYDCLSAMHGCDSFRLKMVGLKGRLCTSTRKGHSGHSAWCK